MKYLPLLLILFLTSCYDAKLATKQTYKAHALYPEVTAKFCAEQYKPDTSMRIEIRTETQTDTVYQDGEVRIFNDTVYITKYKVITNTNTVYRDSIRTVTNTAALAELQVRLDASQATTSKLVDENQTLRKGRNTWRWIGIGSLLAILIALVIFVWGKIKNFEVKRVS